MVNVIAVTAQLFASIVLESPKPVVIDFWATWCQPCKQFKPIFEELSVEYPEYQFVSINIDEAQEIAIKYGITQIPTIAVFNNGTLYQKFTGAIAKAEFKANIETALAQEPLNAELDKKLMAQQQLLGAITQGNIDAVRSCLANGANPNHVYSFPMPMGPDKGKMFETTALGMSMGNMDIVQMLLEAGASGKTIIKTPDGQSVTVRDYLDKTSRDYFEKIQKVLALIDQYSEKRMP